MDLLFFQYFQPLYTIRSLVHFISLTFQIDLYAFPDLFIVLYYQYMIHFHCFSLLHILILAAKSKGLRYKFPKIF